MAFGLQYLARAALTQQYDHTLNTIESLVANRIPSIWSYNALATGANDATATVEGAGYFNGANGYLVIGDLIYAACSDALHLLTVTTNAAGAVTTTAFV